MKKLVKIVLMLFILAALVCSLVACVEDEPSITSITVNYTQGEDVVYPDTALADLKDKLVVKVNYDDGTENEITDFALSGTLNEGESTVTVTYGDFTKTFTVNVSHKHTLEEHSEKGATCIEDGNIEYWHCEGCDKYFQDQNANTEIDWADIVIEAGHKYADDYTCHDRVCGRCGHTGVATTAHNYVEGVCVCAQDYYTEGMEFRLISDDAAYEVSGYTGTANEVVIPKTYNGKNVTVIGDYAFYGCNSLTSITIPDGVTSIGEGAFYNCASLSSIAIPDSVTAIEYSAFSYCISLTSIAFGDGSELSSIGERAFYDCHSLTSIAIPDGVTSMASEVFYDCSALTVYCEEASKPGIWKANWNSTCPVVWDSANTEIANDGYIYTVIDGIRYGIKDEVAMVAAQPRNTTTTSIPASITYKGATYAVTNIGENAFLDCTSLSSITIPESVRTIGNRAFYGCDSLMSITIPDVNMTIGDEVFLDTAYYDDESKWEDEVLYIGAHLIRAKETISGSYTVKEGTKSISAYAFYYCVELTAVSIPDSVMTIAEGAFYICPSLTSVTFGADSALTTIGKCAFFFCYYYGSGSIVIPDSVTSIGSEAFGQCASLTIYCEQTSKPSTWSGIWNYNNQENGSHLIYWYSENEPTASGRYWHYVGGTVTIW